MPVELHVWWCPGCKRYFIRGSDQWPRYNRHLPQAKEGRLPVNWCSGPAVVTTEHPEVLAAWLMGGVPALNAINGDKPTKEGADALLDFLSTNGV